MRLAFPTLLPLLLSVPAAPAPEPTATFTCPAAPEPGRVRCELEVKPATGAAIAWADVVLTSAPPFATLLRARLGPADATTREETVWHWTLALAARGRGSGELEGRVRIVSCVGDVCTPSQVAVRAPVVVGDARSSD